LLWKSWWAITLSNFISHIFTFLQSNKSEGLTCFCSRFERWVSRSQRNTRNTIKRKINIQGYFVKCHCQERSGYNLRKCVLVHSGFHYILSEFGHFYLVKLFNPLVNRDRLLWTMTWNKVTFKEKQIYQTIHLLVN
jgi:hypothetical protein